MTNTYVWSILYTRWVNNNAYCLAMLVLCCVVLCCVVLSGQMGHLDEEQALTNP